MTAGRFSVKFVLLLALLLALTIFGLLWGLVINPGQPSGGFGWYLFAYAMGLTMIVLPCTLPLAFVVVPLALGKRPLKGLGLAAAFSLGVVITLSLYGLAAAAVGQLALTNLEVSLETVKNWVYFVAGIFAYLFALGEVGLVRYRMPTYSGAAPAFIQRQGDYLKALLLGLFLGNIGVGCPHPATPLILTEIASSGDIFYGWTLFLVHAVGRVLPLLILVLLGLIGVNALNWLMERKDRVERATGWAMVFVAAFILVLGLFTHDWWVNSGIHTWLEGITQEERLLGTVSSRLGVAPPHAHGLEQGPGLFGLPLALGNWILVGLWSLPLWWYYIKRRRREKKTTPYHFWFLATLSLLLALTFIYVLPTRFLYQQVMADADHDKEAMGETMEITSGDGGGHAPGATPYHEAETVAEGLVVDLAVRPEAPALGATTTLDFWVRERPLNTPVPVSALEIEHTKLIHVIGVRRDLDGFFHLHPAPTETPGLLTVDHIFRQPGNYKLWAEVKRGGVIHTFGETPFTVSGAEPAAPAEITLGINVIIGDYQVALRLPPTVSAGREVALLFDVHTLDSYEVELEPYLAADMHLAVIKDDWKQFIHTHPTGEIDHHGKLPFVREASANGGGHDTAEGGHGVEFHVTFSEPGLYRVFAQFRPAGIDLPPEESLVAPFWLSVAPAAAARPDSGKIGQTGGALDRLRASRTLLLFISLILIVILGWLVKRFIKVPAAHE